MMRVKCPYCQGLLDVVDVPAGGGQVNCPSCGKVMTISGPATVPSKPVVLKPIIPQRAQPIDDDEVIDLPPAQPTRPAAQRAMPAQPIAPQQAQHSSRQTTTHHHDEEKHKPRRPRKKKKSGNYNVPLLVGGGIALTILVVLGVVLINTLNDAKKPVNMAVVSEASTKQKKAQAENVAEENVASTPKGRGNNNSSDKGTESSEENFFNIIGKGNATEKENNSTAKSGQSDSDNTVQPSSFAGSSEGSGADVYPYVLKSATFILAEVKNGQAVAAGSGSLIDRKNRLVLTNHHVAGDSKHIAVFFPNYDKAGKLVAEKNRFMQQFRNRNLQKQIIEAKVIATDPVCDLCILQLKRLPEGVEALPFAKQSCRVGQRVHSIGNPGTSGALWVYAPGVVRQTYHSNWKTQNDDRSTQNHKADVIETQSPTNHGDSGGPLVNDRGELVGVTHGGTVDGHASISIFIDVSEVKRFVEKGVRENLRQEFVADSRAPLTIDAAANTAAPSNLSLPDLVKSLSSTDSSAKAKAAESLGLMGEKARDAIPSLLKLLTDPDEFVRRTTMTALTKIGTPSKSDINLLITALSDPNVEMRRYAATTLEKMGSDARSVSKEILAAMRDTDPVVRQASARTVGLFGRDVKDLAKGPLEEMLKDNDHDNRLAAAAGLAGILGSSGEVDGLSKLLKHQDTEIRVVAAKACTKLGKNAKPVLGELLTLAKDDTGELRKNVIQLLAQLDPNDAKLGMNLVIDSTKAGDKETRLVALATLGIYAKEMQGPMVAAIKECLKDNELKPACIDALKKLAPSSKNSLGLLVELAKDDDATTSDAAIKAIIDLGPAATGAVSELIKLMDVSGNVVTRDDEARVTKFAEVLAKIGKPAIPTLRRGLASRGITRWGCAIALGEIGPPAREAVRDLQALMQQEPNEFVRKDIQEAIRKILGQ
ncbi:MAG: HEAT repeat domain-containing protein [Planctomycetia bacterium]|nr:HEAT repeat domain-containing protein [Planctomycetia bacterium]